MNNHSVIGRTAGAFSCVNYVKGIGSIASYLHAAKQVAAVMVGAPLRANAKVPDAGGPGGASATEGGINGATAIGAPDVLRSPMDDPVPLHRLRTGEARATSSWITVNPNDYPRDLGEFTDVVLQNLAEEGVPARHLEQLRQREGLWREIHGQVNRGELRTDGARLLLGATSELENQAFLNDQGIYQHLPTPKRIRLKAVVLYLGQVLAQYQRPLDAYRRPITGYPTLNGGDDAEQFANQVIGHAGSCGGKAAIQGSKRAHEQICDVAPSEAAKRLCRDQLGRRAIGTNSRREQAAADLASKEAMKNFNALRNAFDATVPVGTRHPARDAGQTAAILLGATGSDSAAYAGCLQKQMPKQFDPPAQDAPPVPSAAQQGAGAMTPAMPQNQDVEPMDTSTGAMLAAVGSAAGAVDFVLDTLIRTVTLQGNAAAATPIPQTTTPAYLAEEVQEDSRYVSALARSLRGWVDYSKANQSVNAYHALHGVFQHYGEEVPEEFTRTFDITLLEDEERLDEAAVLYHQLRNPGPDAEAAMPRSEQLRTRLLDDLRTEYVVLHALEQLLASPRNISAPSPYFTGFAIADAYNKTFDQVLQSPRVSIDTGFRALSAARQRELLEAKFADVGESTQFEIGTARQSVASTLIRMARYRDQPVPGPFASNQELARAYVEAEQQWAADNSSFPLHPRLQFSEHMAAASGVEVMSTAELKARYDAILAMAQGHILSYPPEERNSNSALDPESWVTSVAARYNRGGARWDQQPAERQRKAIQAVLNGLRAMCERSEEPGFGVRAKHVVYDFAAKVKQAGLLSEVVVGDTPMEKAFAVVEYGTERLYAALSDPPRFDRQAAALKILQEEFRLDPEYARNTGLLEKFMQCVDQPLLDGSKMWIGTRFVKPIDFLQPAVTAYNERLLSDPWVRAKAKENLRLRGAPMRDVDIELEMRSVAEPYKAESEYHKQLITMLNVELGSIPIVGGIWGIYQGWQHGDKIEMLMGFLNLLEGSAGDLRSLSLKLLKPGMGQALSDFKRITGKLGVQDVPRIDDVPFKFKAPTPGDLLPEAHIASTINFKVRDGNVPRDLRPLAARVRSGERGVTWKGHEVILIENEDRVVPVKNRGGAYQELDWQTEHPVKNGKLIHQDPTSRGYRNDQQLAGGMPLPGHSGRKKTSDGTRVANRETVVAVKELLKPANDRSRQNFNTLFERNFAVFDLGNCMTSWELPGQPGSGMQGFRQFMEQLYDRSETFRRIMNHFDAHGRRVDRRLWKIHFGGRVQTTHAINPRTDHQARAIDIPATMVHAYTAANDVPTYTKENAVVHELIHALLLGKDPNLPDQTVNARPVVPTDTGSPSFLADRILFEMGKDVPERVTYADFRRGAADPRVPVAANDAQLDSYHIDKMLNRHRLPPTADTVVLEQRLAERPTVTQWQQLQQAQRQPPARPSATLRAGRRLDALRERFELPDGAAPRAFESVCKRLLKSRTFRNLLERMPERAEGKWQFVFDEATAQADLPAGQAWAGAADRTTGKLYVFDDHSQYLEQQGLRDTEFERKVTTAFVNAMTEMEAPAQPLKSRGGKVKLVDEILHEAGYHNPTQLVAVRARSNDLASQREVTAELIKARRAVLVEEDYLKLQRQQAA
ncbi:hypothetical protein [Pseudoduganella sp. R-43]|uniref:hypothetical protein n=1 Tax=Pseudoduganella sp. R-43 TaxID=3404063 RepID=UPI003CF76A0F